MIDSGKWKKSIYKYLNDHQHQRGKDVSAQTLRTYAIDIIQYLQYAETHVDDKIAMYSLEESFLKYLAWDYSYFTICKKIQAIRFYFWVKDETHGFSGQNVKACLMNIKRMKQLKQKQAKAFSLSYFKKVLDGLQEDNLRNIRDRALLLVGFAAAMRRSELLALKKDDVILQDLNLLLNISTSKTNQYGKQEYKALFSAENQCYCPVKAVNDLLRVIPKDHLFLFSRINRNGKLASASLSARGLDYIITKLLGEEYSSHSMRVSFVTIAKKNGCLDSEIMQQTNHKNANMILRYTQIHDKTEHNAARKLGL